MTSPLRAHAPTSMAATMLVLAASLPAGCDRPESPPTGPAGSGAVFDDVPTTVFCTGLIDVDGGVIPLACARGGVVAALPVGEGMRVTAGQAIVQLADEADRLSTEAAICRLKGAEEVALSAAAEPERFRLQLQQAEEQLGALRSRLDNVRLQLDTTRQLADLKQAGRLDVLMAEARVDEAAHAVASEKARLEALRLADPSPRLAEANRQVEAARITLRQAELTASLAILRAPCDAIVLRVSAVTAGTVAAGQTLVILQPERPLVARVPLDPEFAGSVRVGDVAEVCPEAGTRDATVWRGRVAAIGGWYAVRRPVGPEVVPPSESRTLECVVVLDERTEQRPRIGLEVEVRIRPAERSLPSSDGDGESQQPGT